MRIKRVLSIHSFAVFTISTYLPAIATATNNRRAAKISKRLSESIDHYDQLETGDSNEKAHGLLNKWECYTIIRPTMLFTVVYLIFQVFVFFIFPLTFLCTSKNIAGALVFIGMTWMSFQKRLLDPAEVLEELGSFASLGNNLLPPEYVGLVGSTNRQDWIYKARLYHIQSMSSDTSRMIWSRTLGTVVWLFMLLAVAAQVGSESSDKMIHGSHFLPPTLIFIKSPSPLRIQCAVLILLIQIRAFSTLRIMYF